MCYLEFIYIHLRNVPQGKEDSIFHCCVDKNKGLSKRLRLLGIEKLMKTHSKLLDLEVGKSHKVDEACGFS